MPKNMGNADKIIRIIISVIIAGLYLSETITGTVGVVLLVLAVIFALTSAVGFCPLYWPFKISTKK
jgi:hypothetical protein